MLARQRVALLFLTVPGLPREDQTQAESGRLNLGNGTRLGRVSDRGRSMPALAIVGVLTVLLFLCFSNAVIALAQQTGASPKIGKQYGKHEGVTDTPDDRFLDESG
jgi:hypothetical protein